MAKFAKTLKRVRENFVPNNLIDICERDEKDFESFGTVRWFEGGDLYVYQDNGADILGIAHLDTVQTHRHATVAYTKQGSPIVLSPCLDDRLGAWVILDLLPRLGIKTDWLLTTGEEYGASTGRDFVEQHNEDGGKRYNWMYQFDRTGTDVVMYDYDTPELRKLLRSVGMQPEKGMFSDISMMEDLGCKGFNVGVGYQDYHSPRAYAWLEDTFSQVARFVMFYRRYAKTAMPHERKKKVWGYGYYKMPNGDVYKYRRQFDADEVAWGDDEEERILTRLQLAPNARATNTFGNEYDPERHLQKCWCGHWEYIHKQSGDQPCEFNGCECPHFVEFSTDDESVGRM